jgi:flagellar hook-associated protein 2
MASNSFQVAGLASNFDWKTFVDQIISLERTPANRLEAEQAANNQKVSLLSTLGTKLSALQTSAQALKSSTLFGARTAASATSGSNWVTSAATGATTGSFSIAVSQLATAAGLRGTNDIGAALNPAGDDVSGLTLANLPIGQAVTAGMFTVNGQQVTVALTDSLQDVFDAIATATGGDVTASYDHVSDTVELTSATSELRLGAANDTSNFLRALKLGNNGTDTATSAGRLGTLKTTATLASANLATAVTSTAGTFSINGVAIAYDMNTDTLAGVIKRINDSSAGVVASYDALNDRMQLTNASTGDLGVAVSEAAGGLLGALGLTGGATFSRGRNAEFTINGGDVLSSASNTLDAAAHGVTGLSVTVKTLETQTITVAADTGAMRSRIDSFVTDFNSIQQFIEAQSKVTKGANGKVTTAPLANNREVQEWARSLRSLAFDGVSGLGGSIGRLDDLGLDFKSGTNELMVKNEAKLTAALSGATADVEGFFTTASTGFAARLDSFLGKIGTQNTNQQTQLNQNNTRIDEQIAAIERRLEQRRTLMESAFIRMENAQSKIKQQQTAVESMFVQKSSS